MPYTVRLFSKYSRWPKVYQDVPDLGEVEELLIWHSNYQKIEVLDPDGNVCIARDKHMVWTGIGAEEANAAEEEPRAG